MLQKIKKEKIIKDLEEIIKLAKSIVFVNFHGLKVSDETSLRRDLRKEDVSYKVSRKTLISRAFKGKVKGDMPELTGEIAIAYSPAEMSAPREIYNFQKSHKNLLSILGGVFDGEFINGEKMNQIAMIPSREILYGQFVNLINSPIQRFVIALNEIAKVKN